VATFTTGDYAVMSDEMRRSAVAGAPIVLDWLRRHEDRGRVPRRILDVGCGPGWWAATFAALGCDVAGVDGPDGGDALGDRYDTVDLEGDWAAVTGISWDVAVCLEVAEHLSPDAADTFIRTLTTVAPIVVFSAAIPGQGGVGHVNERWQTYWADLFHTHGWYTASGPRDELWTVDGVAPYYPQNIFVAWSGNALDVDDGDVIDVVHPGVWRHVTRRG